MVGEYSGNAGCSDNTLLKVTPFCSLVYSLVRSGLTGRRAARLPAGRRQATSRDACGSSADRETTTTATTTTGLTGCLPTSLAHRLPASFPLDGRSDAGTDGRTDTGERLVASRGVVGPWRKKFCLFFIGRVRFFIQHGRTASYAAVDNESRQVSKTGAIRSPSPASLVELDPPLSGCSRITSLRTARASKGF